MNTWFISDTHFGHDNKHGGIVKMCNRPFANVAEMDEEMIRRWNSRVAPNDTVYHLGDFGFGNWRKQMAIRERLNGSIILILGNHDYRNLRHLGSMGFVAVHDLKEIEVEGQTIMVCHYPMVSWSKSFHGSLMLHGHCHGNLPATNRRLDVGVDAWDYQPVSLSEILARMNESPLTFRGKETTVVSYRFYNAAAAIAWCQANIGPTDQGWTYTFTTAAQPHPDLGYAPTLVEIVFDLKTYPEVSAKMDDFIAEFSKSFYPVLNI